MAATDVSTILSTVRWSEDSYYLKEFLHKYKLPQVIRTMRKIKR